MPQLQNKLLFKVRPKLIRNPLVPNPMHAIYVSDYIIHWIHKIQFNGCWKGEDDFLINPVTGRSFYQRCIRALCLSGILSKSCNLSLVGILKCGIALPWKTSCRTCGLCSSRHSSLSKNRQENLSLARGFLEDRTTKCSEAPDWILGQKCDNGKMTKI